MSLEQAKPNKYSGWHKVKGSSVYYINIELMQLKWREPRSYRPAETCFWRVKRISSTKWQTSCMGSPSYPIQRDLAIWSDSLVGGNVKFVEKLYRNFHSLKDIEYEQYFAPKLCFKFKSLDSRSYEIKKELEELLSKTAKEFLDSIEQKERKKTYE